jgi:hypothetical protein
MIRTSNKPRTYTCKDVYKEYAKSLLRDNPTWWGKYDKRLLNYYVFRQEGTRVIEVISYPRFRTIIETWFKGAQNYIINGEVLTLGNNLGRIAGRMVERNFKNKQPDWKKTYEMWEKKGERKGLVYHLSEDWVRIGWNKPGKIRHEHFYRFTPAEGNSVSDIGFKKAFSISNASDPTLKLRYQYFPYHKAEE